MMNADLLERNIGFANQHPEELDGTLDLQNGSANCCKFNRWGTLVAVGSTDGRVFIFDFVTKGIVKTWTAHALPVSSLSWSRDGRKLLTASADTTVAIWDVLQGMAIHKLKFSSMVVAAIFNPRNDNQVLVLQLNFPPTLEELSPPQQRQLINDIPGAVDDGVTAIAFDRKARYIITGTSKGKIILYDTRTLKMVSWCKQNSAQQVRQIVIPRRGNFIFTNSQDRIIRANNLDDLIDCHNGATIEPKFKVQDIVNKAAWKSVCTDSEGDYICGASNKANSLYIWERASGTLMKILHGTKGEVLLDVIWHPTRPVILSVANGTISIWTQAHVENWSAFAPEFTELEENQKYVEKEGEFDMYDSDATEDGNDNDQHSDEEDIDVVNLKPSEMLCSSDEEADMCGQHDLTLKSGPLWFLPITPEIENPECNIHAVFGEKSIRPGQMMPPPLQQLQMEEENRKRPLAAGSKPTGPAPKGRKPK